MKEKNRFSKPVAFNKTNESDQRILKHVSRRNFSGYVKKLILADIEKGKPQKEQEGAQEAFKQEEKPQSAAERLEQLKKRSGASAGPQLFINQSKN